MPKAKLSKQFDYYVKGSRMISYPPGYNGDMPQAHYDAAVAAGVIKGDAPAGGSGGAPDKPAK